MNVAFPLRLTRIGKGVEQPCVILIARGRNTFLKWRLIVLNKLISNILPYMPKKLVWQFSKDYVAGETIEDAVKAAKKLNEQGILTTIDVLGEFITNLDEAEANKNEYLEVIEKAEAAGVNGNYSLKPTAFGLLIDKEAAFKYIREVV